MLAEILDFIWPRNCEVCGRPVDRPGRQLCSDCVMRLPFVPTDGVCRRCGRDASGLDGEYLCEECRREHHPHFDRAASVLRFEGEARELVNAFKFRERLHLRTDLVDFLEGAARARFRVDELACVLPMPSTIPHRFVRGYNQCDYLASGLASRLGVACCVRAVRRTGSPRRQGELSEDERRTNVVGTFAVTPSGMRMLAQAGKRPVLVVDDIMTTGSTLSECARTLKNAGAGKVWCLTLARSFRG